MSEYHDQRATPPDGEERAAHAGTGIAIGVALGVAVGLVIGLLLFDNPSYGVGIGIAIGAGLGAAGGFGWTARLRR